MKIKDGRKYTRSGHVACTRWEELRASVDFHAQVRKQPINILLTSHKAPYKQPINTAFVSSVDVPPPPSPICTQLADTLQWASKFWLINPPPITPGTASAPEQVVTLGVPNQGGPRPLSRLRATMRSEPKGKTPLCDNLAQIRDEVMTQVRR
jgi:hypothetical protein